MANTSNIFGFKYAGSLDGEVNPSIIVRNATASHEICPGDPVVAIDGGSAITVGPHDSSDGTGLLGIAQNYVSSTATDRAVRIIPALGKYLWEVQVGAADATGLQADDIDKCADYVTASGSVGTGPFGTAGQAISGAYLSDTIAGTAANFKIISLANGYEYGANAHAIVCFNEGQFTSTAAGVANA